jgi:hypothetical protein
MYIYIHVYIDCLIRCFTWTWVRSFSVFWSSHVPSFLLCARRFTDTNNITNTHNIYIYSVFIYIQCKQWLNISLWLPGVHRMNDFHQFRMASRTKKPVEDKETPNKCAEKGGMLSCLFMCSIFFVIVWCVFPICCGGLPEC